MLFDSHCHLDFPALREDLEGVLGRAREAGVEQIVTIGASRGLDSADAALEIAAQHAGFVHASVGIHPHSASCADRAHLERLERLAADPRAVAIGETGLDYHYNNSTPEEQRGSFRATIGIARKVGKPLIIHTRSAADDTIDILREEGAQAVGGIIHCFSEDVRFARRALDLGFVCSFSGLVTFPKAVSIMQAACELPLDSILVETDAPFLAPIPHRGRQNEPAFVAHTARAIADKRNIEFETFSAITTVNARRVYGLDGTKKEEA